MCIRDRFKTPINAIEGYTMLLQGEELSQEQEEYVEKILFNTQRLSGLVGNILLLSKLENQNIPMKKTEYRLDEQIRQAFLSLEKMCIRDSWYAGRHLRQQRRLRKPQSSGFRLLQIGGLDKNEGASLAKSAKNSQL